jgi:hypothetical protein
LSHVATQVKDRTIDPSGRRWTWSVPSDSFAASEHASLIPRASMIIIDHCVGGTIRQRDTVSGPTADV